MEEIMDTLFSGWEMIELDFALVKGDERMISLFTGDERPIHAGGNGSFGELESLSSNENSAEKSEFIPDSLSSLSRDENSSENSELVPDLLSWSGSWSWVPGGDIERDKGLNGNAVVEVMDWARGCVCIANRNDFKGVEVYCASDRISCGRVESWGDGKNDFRETEELAGRDTCGVCSRADNRGDNDKDIDGAGKLAPSLLNEGSRGCKESWGDGFGEVGDSLRMDAAEGECWRRGEDGGGCIGTQVAFFLSTDGLSPL